MTAEELLRTARRARENAYAPYSGFAVGAALLAKDGRVYTGCNIENAAFTPTVCAERVAVFSALADGVRDFTAIAVVGGPAGKKTEKPCTPCGVCRQVLAEFCDADGFTVYTEDGNGAPVARSLAALLPFAFGKNDL